MKKRVLFVDDEPNVLSGLQRMLRVCRNHWDMEFAPSGSAALATLASSTVDVVVTDMRMPEMDGAQLLDEVRQRHPEIVRIILSGQSDQESILRSLGPAHQFLSKPCSPELLQSTITRACALRDRLQNADLKQLISQAQTLPSLPSVYSKLVDELNTPEPQMNRVAQLISQDVGMTCKLLQLVNSSFFGVPRHVESPAHAAKLLGVNLIRTLVFSAGIFSQFPESNVALLSLTALIEHSLMVSAAARRIAELQQPDSHELGHHALLAGLVHDVGQLVLAKSFRSVYAQELQYAVSHEQPLVRVELRRFGVGHADIGAYLLGLWGIPDVIVEAVAFHHDPQQCPNLQFSPLTAVHVANALVNERHPERGCIYDQVIDEDYLRQLGLLDRLPAWREAVDALISVRNPT
jgi:HD-like signal output (HDOD) protein